jgi:hypothetical protein
MTAYWINCFRAVSDPAKLAEYVKLAGPVIQSSGGRFLVRGQPAKVFEAGFAQRTVIVTKRHACNESGLGADDVRCRFPVSPNDYIMQAAQCNGAGFPRWAGETMASCSSLKKLPKMSNFRDLSH